MLEIFSEVKQKIKKKFDGTTTHLSSLKPERLLSCTFLIWNIHLAETLIFKNVIICLNMHLLYWQFSVSFSFISGAFINNRNLFEAGWSELNLMLLYVIYINCRIIKFTFIKEMEYLILKLSEYFKCCSRCRKLVMPTREEKLIN